MTLSSALSLFAQVQIRKRSGGEASCVQNDGFCPQWIVDNFHRYVDPFWHTLFLVGVSVAMGFAIAATLALLAHRHRWLTGPTITVTGILYTVPSLAAFFLLQPLTGRGDLTAIVALTAYTLLIIFRNFTTGLRGVAAETTDAARGMGLTPNQILFRVELPLALPEILAGLRVATVTTVGLAALAFAAGAGGLGEFFATGNQIVFKSNVVVAGGLCVLMAVALDMLILLAGRLATPWSRA